MEVGKLTGIQSTQAFNASEKVAPQPKVDLESKDNIELSKEAKQEIVKNAKTKAAGWSTFFGFINTLQYGLRSDKKVAEKFNLDKEKDADLIKTIKREQVKSTLPAVIGNFFGVHQKLGLGDAWGGGAWAVRWGYGRLAPYPFR